MTSAYALNFFLGILLVVFLVLLNGFFVAAEFAIVKLRETQLLPLIRKGDRRARTALRVVKNLDASLSATQLGITLASLGLGWFAEPVFARLLDPAMDALGIESEQLRHSVAFAVGFSIITFLHIVVGELAPKSLAISKPLPTTLWVSTPLLWFHKASLPFIWLLNSTALGLLRRSGIEPASEAELTYSEEELRLLLGAAQKHSGATALGREVVLNALDLRRRRVREVMRPRREIVGLNTEASITECLDIAEQTRYSRFPLCERGDVDKTLGVVHIKDIYLMRRKAQRAADLLPVARKLLYVPESARLETVLQQFLERRLHFAIVVDEYGSTAGMLTLENILEELVGPIQDEFDQEAPVLVRMGEHTWEVDGALPLHELSEMIGQDLRQAGIATAGGWITYRLKGFPKVGDTLTAGPWTMRVEEMDGLRVGRLRLTRASDAAPPLR